MIVWGGWSQDDSLVDGAGYDPTVDSWRILSDSAWKPGHPDYAVVMGGNWMFVWDNRTQVQYEGGWPSHSVEPPYSLAYESTDDRWVELPPGPLPPREEAATIWTGSEVILWGDTHTVNKYESYPQSDGAAIRLPLP
ncbi:MAG: hypothetical protein ACRDI1_02760 [Actinomycetota bacterium]